MKAVLIYDGSSDANTDPQLCQALDIIEDVRDIQAILTKSGYATEIIGFQEPLLKYVQTLVKAKPDVVFNQFEGLGTDSSYEMHMASLLDFFGISYTGSGAAALSLCHHKATAKSVLNDCGVPTPKHLLIEQNHPVSRKGLEFPLIVKPVHEDGSIGIDEDSVVYDNRALKRKIALVHERFQQPALIEEYIEGREFNVSILGNDPFDFVQIREIHFSLELEPKILSFSAKWNKDSAAYQGAVSKPASHLPESICRQMTAVAVQCFKIFKMRDYARVDFRMGRSQVPYVIDVNPNPCISRDSGMAMAAEQNGVNYDELIRKITAFAGSRIKFSDRARGGVDGSRAS